VPRPRINGLALRLAVPDAVTSEASDRVIDPALRVQLAAYIAAAPDRAITFSVGGRSATKGSTVAFVTNAGEVKTAAANKLLASWCEDVAWSARAARVKRVAKPGAVAVRLLLVFERPKTVPVDERPHMTVPPDADKCLRAALDALTGVAYDDDAQVVHAHAFKIYGPRAEVVFQVWEV
jgi:Holliday junction resolvase RusA-like endonuclease